MNIPPDECGHIREYEANTTIRPGKRPELKQGKPLPKNSRPKDEKNTIPMPRPHAS
ncbi:hypothetical protein [Bacteroides acidifaciens]|uniref:hypothetical protein n=1 Tax=Bacteroides acidifaciens TaxID=85831 RepID=UPI00259B78CF|nr:hypothetical protein [Bacteroides acidifaciens]